MWFGGSWDIPVLDAEINSFDWDVLAVPPPKGKPSYVTFHPDFAVGLNANSPHKVAAKKFLQCLSNPETASLSAAKLPGFFPLHKQVSTVENSNGDRFLKLNRGRDTDIRLAWSQLGDGIPDGYSLIEKWTIAVLQGRATPTEVANNLQNGLAQWFELAYKCRTS